MRLADTLKEESLYRRDQIATNLFGIKRIRELMHQRTLNGHRFLRVFQSSPFDLEDQPATQELLTWLKKEGFSFTWEYTAILADVKRPGSHVPYQELVIKW